MPQNFSNADMEQFLKLMSQLETSGGQNMNHPRLPNGEQAFGEHALLPRTTQSLAQSKIRNNEEEPIDEVIAGLDRKKNPDAINQVLSDNPDTEQEYKEKLARNVLTKMSGDPVLGASSWLYGTNLNENQAKNKLQQDPEYFQRIKQAQDSLAGQSKPDEYFDRLKTLIKPKKSKIMSGGE